MAVAASDLQLESEEVAEDQDDLVQPGRSKGLDEAGAEVREEAKNTKWPMDFQ